MPRDGSYDYTGVVNTNEAVAPGAGVMVVVPILTKGFKESDVGALVAVVQTMSAAPVLPVERLCQAPEGQRRRQSAASL